MLRLAFLLALACTMITGCGTTPAQPGALPACKQPPSMGQIDYACEDGTYRCTTFDGHNRYPAMPCIDDVGTDTPITCVETCGDAWK